jgi:hypothetical protein
MSAAMKAEWDPALRVSVIVLGGVERSTSVAIFSEIVSQSRTLRRFHLIRSLWPL